MNESRSIVARILFYSISGRLTFWVQFFGIALLVVGLSSIGETSVAFRSSTDDASEIRNGLRSDWEDEVDASLYRILPGNAKGYIVELCYVVEHRNSQNSWNALALLVQEPSFDSMEAEPVWQVAQQVIGHREHRFRQLGVDLLVLLGKSWAGKMEVLLESPRGTVRAAAIDALSQLEAFSSERAMEALSDKDPRVRYAAIHTVKVDDATVTQIVSMLKDPEAAVAGKAAQQLNSYQGTQHREHVIHALTESLGRDGVSSIAASSLESCGILARGSLPALIRNAGRRSIQEENLLYGAEWISIGPPDIESLAEVLDLLRDPEPKVRMLAASTIRLMKRNPVAAKALTEVFLQAIDQIVQKKKRIDEASNASPEELELWQKDLASELIAFLIEFQALRQVGELELVVDTLKEWHQRDSEGKTFDLFPMLINGWGGFHGTEWLDRPWAISELRVLFSFKIAPLTTALLEELKRNTEFDPLEIKSDLMDVLSEENSKGRKYAAILLSRISRGDLEFEKRICDLYDQKVINVQSFAECVSVAQWNSNRTIEILYQGVRELNKSCIEAWLRACPDRNLAIEELIVHPDSMEIAIAESLFPYHELPIVMDYLEERNDSLIRKLKRWPLVPSHFPREAIARSESMKSQWDEFLRENKNKHFGIPTFLMTGDLEAMDGVVRYELSCWKEQLTDEDLDKLSPWILKKMQSCEVGFETCAWLPFVGKTKDPALIAFLESLSQSNHWLVRQNAIRVLEKIEIENISAEGGG